MRKGFAPLSLLKASAFIFLIVLLVSCGETKEPETAPARIGAGNIELGGLFTMNLTDNMRSIFPHNMVDAASFNLMNQVYEGLLKYDPSTGEILPALAETYEKSADGKTFTFKLRKGIYFHDDEAFEGGIGREVKAEDIVFCFQKLCEPSPDNELFAMVIDLIEGGRESYEKGSALTGVRALDDYTVEIKLEYAAPTFESILAHPGCWIFPKELYSYESRLNSWCIGTGPFKARTIKIDDVIILERNKSYWQRDQFGNQLPYLDAVRCNFVKNEMDQLNYFLEGDLDLILKVPFESVSALRERINSEESPVDYSILTFPGLRVEYYGFQHRSDLFADPRLRKAINYAIDREFLTDSILLGFGDPAKSFVPASMPSYPSDSIKGYEYNPAKARALLEEAGYPNGEGFPVLTLQLNDGSSTVLSVAEAVQKMITNNLGITLELSVLPRAKHYERVEQGEVLFWRDGWIADYADPENFLKLFHGKLVPDDSVKSSYLNSVRFKDAEFDRYFESSQRGVDDSRRMELALSADKVLLDKAVVVPLYYEKWIWLIHNKVRNLEASGLGILDLSRVYFSNSTDQTALSENS
jgi:peptide/nickel transport system substrate-binding protein